MERVQLMRYVVTTRYKEGNRETIWGHSNQGTMIIGSLPHRVIKNNQGTWKAGYSGISPTLNTVERFYTENGIPIEKTISSILNLNGSNVQEYQDVTILSS